MHEHRLTKLYVLVVENYLLPAKTTKLGWRRETGQEEWGRGEAFVVWILRTKPRRLNCRNIIISLAHSLAFRTPLSFV